MENKRDWSKLIALALSFIIVTQFIQVAFLGAQKFGIGASSDAGANASRGSFAEEAYGAVWEYVGDSDSMIMTSEAAPGSDQLPTTSMNVTIQSASFNGAISDNFSSLSTNDDIEFTFIAQPVGEFSGNNCWFKIDFSQYMTNISGETIEPNTDSITLDATSDDCIYVIIPNTATMSSNNTYTIKAKAQLDNAKLNTAGDKEVAFYPTLSGKHTYTMPAKYTPPVATDITAQVTVKEKDNPTNTISGATFKLYKGNTDTGRVAGPTDNDGIATITVSENGVYSLRQSNNSPFSANGKSYYKSNTLYAFSVNDGAVSALDTGGGSVVGTTISFTVENEVYSGGSTPVVPENATIYYGVTENLRRDEDTDGHPVHPVLVDYEDSVFELKQGSQLITVDTFSGNYYMKSLSAGDYTLTQKTAAKNHSISGNIVVSFSVSTNGTFNHSNGDWDFTASTVKPIMQTSYKEAKVYFLNTISQSEVSDGTIHVSRVVKTSQTGNPTISLNGVGYKLYKLNSTSGEIEATTKTAITNASGADFTALSSGTYYLEETNNPSPNTYSDVMDGLVGSTAIKGMVSNDKELWGPIDISSSAKDREVTMIGYRVVKLSLKDKIGTSAATYAYGEDITITGTAGTFLNDASATSYTWKTKNEDSKISGVFADNATYTAVIPSLSGNGNENVVFSISDNGNVHSTSHAVPKNGVEAETSTNALTITRSSDKAVLRVPILDADSSPSELINDGNFKVVMYTGEAPADTDTALTGVTITNGVIKATIAPPTSGTDQYAIIETTKPVGYKSTINSDNGTKSYFRFTIGTDCQITTNNGGGTWGTYSKTNDAIPYSRILGLLKGHRTDAAAVTNNAKYQLYTLTGTTVTPVAGKEVTIGSDGSFSFNNLKWGKNYLIRETTTKTSTYSPDESGDVTYDGKSYYGPFVFGTDAETTQGSGTLTKADMTITVNITPKQELIVNFILKNSAGTQIASAFTVSGNFAGGKKTSTFTTISTANAKATTADKFLTGETYNVKQTTASATNSSPVEFTFSIDKDGVVTIGTQTSGTASATQKNGTEPAYITMSEALKDLAIRMEISTAEKGYTSVADPDEELTYAKGFNFALYDKDKKAYTTSNSPATDSSGSRLAVATTDANGYIHFYGLPDETYYIKSNNTSAVSDAGKVELDSTSYFKITVANGKISKIEKDGSGKWKVDGNNIRAFLQTSTFSLKANSDKTFYLYRLDNNSGKGDGREDKKLQGKIDDFQGSSTASGYTKLITARLDTLLRDIKDVFVLHAMAASAQTMTYGGNTWELLTSATPGNGNTYEFTGLIVGQRYLLKEGEVGDNPKYYLVDVTSDTLKRASVASTASSGASTAKSGASGTNAGSGTQSNGTGAGGRGAATGDDSRLWFHLIVMLIAFDALAADLLYITRKKKKVRS